MWEPNVIFFSLFLFFSFSPCFIPIFFLDFWSRCIRRKGHWFSLHCVLWFLCYHPKLIPLAPLHGMPLSELKCNFAVCYLYITEILETAYYEFDSGTTHSKNYAELEYIMNICRYLFIETRHI